MNQLDAIRERIALRIAKKTFVVLIKHNGKLNLIVDPGLGKPWSSQLQRHAEQVAKECDGMCVTFEDAFKLLMKDQGGEASFEKVLMERIAQLASIPKPKFFKTNTNQIVDKHGNPIASGN